MEQDLAQSEHQISMKNDALARKVLDLQEQRRQREEAQDSRQQHLSNQMNETRRRGEESLRKAKRDTEVNVEELATLFVDITDVLNKASEIAEKKVSLIKAILEGDMFSESSAQLKLVARGLGMSSTAELDPRVTNGVQNKDILVYLDNVTGGRSNWIDTHRRIAPKLSSNDPELELFNCFVTLQMLSGTHSDAELAKCHYCLAKYAGTGGSITVLQKKKPARTVPQQNKVLTDMRNSVLYTLLTVSIRDAESQGNPSLAASSAPNPASKKQAGPNLSRKVLTSWRSLSRRR